jgi:2-polyprenyl-3-methyl-5-hydroxy-6-metoxy-1,4-benzoquinol methylase
MKTNMTLYNADYKKSRLKLFTKTYDYLIKLADIQKTDKVLDIGAESKELIEKIMQVSDDVTAIDINEDAIKEANMPNFLHMDAINMTFKNNTFDIILSSHVIEHIPDPNKFLTEISRVLKPGGKIILAYPFEIIRGNFHLRCGIFSGWKYHLHKLNPRKIKKFTENTDLHFVKGGLFLSDFLIYPSYYTILEKSS